MSDAVVIHINTVLSEGILKAYKAGIKAVVEKNKISILRTGKEPAFNKYDDDFEPSTKIDKSLGKSTKKKSSPVFQIDYTAEDLEAIRNFRIEAFTVATIGDYELQEKLKALAEETIREKQSDIEHFTNEARRISNRYIRGDWLKTNLTTATSSSYRAAEWIRLQDPAVIDIYPAYQYKTRNDSHVRDEHRKLANKVFRNHDPILKSIYPPNGWNCRCFVVPLNQDEVNSGQYNIENEFRNEAQTKELLNDAFPNPKDAKNFMRNPGESKSIWNKWINEKLSGFDGQVKEEIKSKVRDYANGIKNDELIIPPTVKLPVKPEFPETLNNFVNTDFIPDWFKNGIGEMPSFTFKKSSFTHYNPDTHNVNINPDRLVTVSQKQMSLAHELSHSAHVKNNWITFNSVDDKIKNSYNKSVKHFDKLKPANKKRFGKPNEADSFFNFYDDIRHSFRDMDPSDLRNQLGAMFDTVAALTKGKLGHGHPESYFKKNNLNYMEYFAHGAENKIVGNKVFKKLLPKVYNELVKLIENKFEIK